MLAPVTQYLLKTALKYIVLSDRFICNGITLALVTEAVTAEIEADAETVLPGYFIWGVLLQTIQAAWKLSLEVHFPTEQTENPWFFP